MRRDDGEDDVLLFVKSTTLRGFRIATFTRKTLPFHKLPNATPFGLFPPARLTGRREYKTLPFNIQCYPCNTESAHETDKSFLEFLEPSQAPQVVFSDNSMEFGKACEILTWNHGTSTPHRSEKNVIAERAVLRVKEGTSAVLLQSGLDEKWWSD